MPKDKFMTSLRHVLKQLEPLHGTLLLPSESDGDLAIDFDDIKQRLSSIYLEIQQDKNQPTIKRAAEEPQLVTELIWNFPLKRCNTVSIPSLSF